MAAIVSLLETNELFYAAKPTRKYAKGAIK
jgi:hypothetical protein